MGKLTLSRKNKLIAIIAISFTFFVLEIVVAFMTKSLALLADAFHYLNDLIGFVVALVAVIISEREKSPQDLSFGWARAQLLGAFFNGVFLLALGVSIFLQSIERFVSLERVENPKLVLIVGCVGLALNIISATILHEHHHHGPQTGAHSHGHSHDHGHTHDEHVHQEQPGDVDLAAVSQSVDAQNSELRHHEHHHTNGYKQSHGHDLGILGVMIHVIGDAINNIGVIVVALVIWLTKSDKRFYADPAIGLGIALMILLSSIPLVKNSGKILLQAAPRGLDLNNVKHDLEKIPGIESIHELHIWQLDQEKVVASAHVVVSDGQIVDFVEKARTVSECLHAYGIHSATLQPEPSRLASSSTGVVSQTPETDVQIARRRPAQWSSACQIACGKLCDNLTCCTSTTKE